MGSDLSMCYELPLLRTQLFQIDNNIDSNINSFTEGDCLELLP